MKLFSRAFLLMLLMAVQPTLLVFAASDDTQAERWFRLAAEQGHADAQYDLGLMYANGEGVVEDDTEGAHWLRMAAGQGHAEAQYRLGRMFEEGEGVARDPEEAVRWYRLAGEQGIVLAQYQLGKLYASTEENSSAIPEATLQPSPQMDVAKNESEPWRNMLAACAFVEPPTILQGISSSADEMSDLTVSVRDYIAAMQESLSCMKSVEETLDETISDERRESIHVVYNNGVDQLNFIADEFNKQVREYKLRQRSVDRLEQELGNQ